MGRLIDADILIAELKESALHHCDNPREDSLLQRDRVIVRAQPTVDAIPRERIELMKNEFIHIGEGSGWIDISLHHCLEIIDKYTDN